MLRMSSYVVKMRHDGGIINFHVVARNAKVARHMVLVAEHAPERAVLSVKRKTKKRKRSRR